MHGSSGECYLGGAGARSAIETTAVTIAESQFRQQPREARIGAEWLKRRLGPDVDEPLAFLAQPQESEPGVGWGGPSDVPPGAALVTTSDFEPGEFVLGTLPAIRHETSRALIVAGHGRGDR